MAEPKHIIEARSDPYRADYAAWASEQARLLLARRFDELDLEHLAEEVEDLGQRYFDRFASALAIVLLHMLKWDQQPERRTPSWRFSILEHRRRAERLLAKHPSFKSRIDEALREAYRYAPLQAAAQTGIHEDDFPETNPYSWDEIMSRPFELEPDTEPS